MSPVGLIWLATRSSGAVGACSSGHASVAAVFTAGADSLPTASNARTRNVTVSPQSSAIVMLVADVVSSSSLPP